MTEDAKIISSKIEFNAFRPEPPPTPLPDDWDDVFRGASVMACAMVPAMNGDEYDEALTAERNRVANGIIRMKGELYFRPFKVAKMPAASDEEIIALLHSPHYQRWQAEIEFRRDHPYLLDEYYDDAAEYHDYHDGDYHRTRY